MYQIKKKKFKDVKVLEVRLRRFRSYLQTNLEKFRLQNFLFKIQLREVLRFPVFFRHRLEKYEDSEFKFEVFESYRRRLNCAVSNNVFTESFR